MSFSIFEIEAQNFGGFPPSFEWYHLENNTANIIFPKGLENQAARVASVVDYLAQNNTRSIGTKFSKIDIVLQNQTVISNGYVGLAPFRSEFYVTPMQESNTLGSLPWLDLLAIHEYRHVMQYNNSLNGLSKIPYLLGGEFGWAIAANVAVPNWFWEGDAVMQETALSNQGRGRLPSFYNGFKSLAKENVFYKYHKVRNGSLNHFVPDHYKLGYLMVQYGRMEFGNDFWREVFRKATKFNRFYPFSRAIKRQTPYRLNVADFYNEMMYFNKSKWDKEWAGKEYTYVENWRVAPTENFTSYNYPQYVNNDTLVALKSSYDEIPKFYLVDKYGNESPLATIGYSTEDYFHYKNKKIVWSELTFDPRWGNFDYSIIKTYNFISKKTISLTFDSKYFSPSFNQDASKIVVFSALPDMKYRIEILDTLGNVLKILPNEANLYFTYPKFSEDESEIISSARNAVGEMALVAQNIETGTIRNISPFSNNIVGIHSSKNDRIFFEASYSGTDNLFCVNSDGTNLSQVTSLKLGNYQMGLNESGTQMVFTEFTHMGYKLRKTEVYKKYPILFNIINISQQTNNSIYSAVEEGGDITQKVDTTRKYNVKEYSRGANAINFHSWQPIFENPYYGLNLISNNILNNVNFNIGGGYNGNERAFFYNSSATFGKYFTVFDVGVQGNSERRLAFNQATLRENGVFVDASWPLNFTKGYYQTYLMPKIGISLKNIQYNNFVDYDPVKGYNIINYYSNDIFLNRSLVFLNAKRSARKNIYSPIGQYISLSYLNLLSLFNKQTVHLGIAEYEFSFPAFGKNDNFVIEGNVWYETPSRYYRFANTFFMPRGYIYNPNFDFKGTFTRVGLNYHFPIAYPNWGFAGLIYFYRLRGNLFADFGYSSYNGNNNQSVSSIGLEIITDVNIFNILPFSYGIRGTNKFENTNNSNPFLKNPNLIEFFIPLKRL